MRHLGIDQSLRDDADHFAARRHRRIGHRAHQPQPTAAIDEADAPLGQRAANLFRTVNIHRVRRRRRPTIHRQTLHDFLPSLEGRGWGWVG
ncbi:hypothetical protein D9M73_86370 [compost metagenome]